MESLLTQADASSLRWSFDAFLSFRGEDTRSNFTSHLDMALRQRGINVFIDYKLPRGEDISSSLLKTIEESMISIVIISENYASSSWCLDELVKIIDCKKSKGQIVFPVFYKVDPSHVRKQMGSFGEALTKHQVKHWNKMQAWKEALTVVPHLSGWVLREGNEADLIQEIVEELLAKLNRRAILHVAMYPVGIDSQIQAMNLLSLIMSDCVMKIGIYGIGGMGKTTLAKALYNKIANQFEGCSFLANVREASKQFGGLVQLQETLLSDILMCNLKVGNLDKGISIISDRLRSKKVLIVLDDVDEHQQLQALFGRCDWFSQGSKIIVTTRNKRVLSIHEFDVLHHIQNLNGDQALELFSWHAFKQNHPSSGYFDLSKRAVNYCKGLPLALVVLGSFLCTCRDQSNWKGILDEYEQSSLDNDIRSILQISYDALEEQVKEIFLYISCLFIGGHIDDVQKMLKACGLYPVKGIKKLMDLSLLTIHQLSKHVQMHELIQQMGETIAISESSEPRKRKTLWIADDVVDVLNSKKGANVVKAMKLNFPKSTELDIDAQAFRNVEDLRLLIVRNATLSKDLEYLPSNLKWIKWHGFPCSSLPSSYNPRKLVTLDLRKSSMKHLGKGFMNCECLKYFDLRYCNSLEEIPDLSTAVNLEKLEVAYCRNLIKVHESVGSLDKLVYLSLNGCYNLQQLPSYLRWKSLEHLSLEDCERLEHFPEIGEEMKSSKKVDIDLSNTAIEKLPPSIGYLTGLHDLTLTGCTNLITVPSTIHCLSSLSHFRLDDCSSLSTFPCSSSSENLSSISWPNLALLNLQNSIISSSQILNLLSKASSWSNLNYLNLENCNVPPDINFLKTLSEAAAHSLEFLILKGNKFSSLPSSFVNFKRLRILDVRDCKLLQEIPKLPTCIDLLDASGCLSLIKFPDNIADVISYEREHFGINGVQRDLIVMNNDIPSWFHYQNEGNSITFHMQHHQGGRELKALAPCIVLEVENYSAMRRMDTRLECKIFIKKKLVWTCSSDGLSLESSSQCMWLLVIDPETRKWCDILDAWYDLTEADCDYCTVYFEVLNDMHTNLLTIRRCGVHVLVKEL